MGSALLERPRRMEEIVTNVSKVISVPLTIKVRVGKDEKAPTGKGHITSFPILFDQSYMFRILMAMYCSTITNYTAMYSV